jgi:hypothetical protein
MIGLGGVLPQSIARMLMRTPQPGKFNSFTRRSATEYSSMTGIQWRNGHQSSLALVLLLCACSTVTRRSETQDNVLVTPLPACFVLHFDQGIRPEIDMGLISDTVSLSGPLRHIAHGLSGTAYTGALSESALKREPVPGTVLAWWQSTADSLWLGADGVIRAGGIIVGPRLDGVWQAKTRHGTVSRGTLSASRIACPRS